MPVPCEKCDEWVELNSTRKSRLTKKLLCDSCCEEENNIKDMIDEIEDIQHMLDTNDPEVKGDRRGWKKNIKELKEKIKNLGYDFEKSQNY